MGDATVTGLINLISFGAYELDQSFIRIVGQSLSAEWVKTYWPDDACYQEGRYLPIAAFPNYPEGGRLPMWSFLWMLHAWENYLHGGDMEDLKENFTYIKSAIENCRRLTNDRGLFDMPGAWNLIEWGNNDLSPYGEVTASNVLLVQCLHRAATMAAALGEMEREDEYRSEAGRRMEAINRWCWDEGRRAYVDTVRDEWAYERYLSFTAKKGIQPLRFEDYLACSRVSIQSNTLALLCGCVPYGRVADVQRIVNMVEDGRYVPGMPANRSIGQPTEEEAPGGIVAVGSPFFLFFSLAALYQTGYADTALKILRRDWAEMLVCGTNTCWETFKNSGKSWTRSIAHAWSAAPAVFLPREVLGVKPLEPGYHKFSIDPKPGDLKWAKGAVCTPHGPIQLQWNRKADGELDIKWQAPPECEKR